MIVGSYFYKFTKETSTAPKGSPIPLEAMDVSLIVNQDDSTGAEFVFPPLPIGYQQIFVISTFRKKTYYAATNREEALLWIHTIRDAQHEAKRRSLGHAPAGSYPKAAWEYYDALGRSLVQSKDRIRTRMEEMEMKALNEEGQIARGFYS